MREIGEASRPEENQRKGIGSPSVNASDSSEASKSGVAGIGTGERALRLGWLERAASGSSASLLAGVTSMQAQDLRLNVERS